MRAARQTGVVGAAAADVVEALRTELGDQPVALGRALEVDRPVAGEDRIEQPDVARHGLGDALVGRGREDDQRPPALRRLEIGDQLRR